MVMVNLLVDFLNTGFSSLVILFLLLTFMTINRNHPPPYSSAFKLAFVLLFLLVILNYGDEMLSGDTGYYLPDLTPERAVVFRQVCAALKYVIEPVIILLQLIIVAPSSRFRFPCILLAVINAAVYLPAAFGARYAFYIITTDEGGTTFQRGPMGYTIYFVLMCYVILLYAYSVMYFRKDQTEHSLLLIALVTLAVADAFAEYTNIMGGHSIDIIVAGTLAYYLYLTSIHHQIIRAEAAENKLKIAQQEMTILRDQIQPHFIYNSLNIIRSLIRKDSRAAISSIDTFSDYLQAHFRTLRHDSMVPFTEELDNVKAYLSLAMADVSRQTQIIWKLDETDFSIPPLCLEPLVENAILHGADAQNGIITIASYRTDQGVAVEVIDNGTGESNPTESRKKRVGIGVENTRKRLQLLCSGTLEMQKRPEGGTCVRMLIPQTQEEDKNENTGR